MVPGGSARAVVPPGGDALAVVRRRLRTQGLTGPGFADAGEAVRALGAVQAQEFPETTWSLGERSRPSSAGLVAEAFDRGDFLRSHVLRPTWHVVAAEDLRWLLRLSAPRVHAVNGTMYRSCGVGPTERESAARLILAELADGPRTRRELAARLAAGGLPTDGVPLAYLIMSAELEGLICSGPMRGRQHTYALLADRVPDADDGPSGAQALEELAVRYFRGHGPATVRDFATWAGMTLSDSRDAVAAAGERLQRRDGEDGTPWYAGPGGFESSEPMDAADRRAGLPGRCRRPAARALRRDHDRLSRPARRPARRARPAAAGAAGGPRRCSARQLAAPRRRTSGDDRGRALPRARRARTSPLSTRRSRASGPSSACRPTSRSPGCRWSADVRAAERGC